MFYDIENGFFVFIFFGGRVERRGEAKRVSHKIVSVIFRDKDEPNFFFF